MTRDFNSWLVVSVVPLDYHMAIFPMLPSLLRIPIRTGYGSTCVALRRQQEGYEFKASHGCIARKWSDAVGKAKMKG